MEKTDIQKLNDFLCRERFGRFFFNSEDQPDFNGDAPLRANLGFSKLTTSEYPAVVMLSDGNNSIVIDRIKKVAFKSSPVLGVGEIAITAMQGGLDKSVHTYMIYAKKFFS